MIYWATNHCKQEFISYAKRAQANEADPEKCSMENPSHDFFIQKLSEDNKACLYMGA